MTNNAPNDYLEPIAYSPGDRFIQWFFLALSLLTITLSVAMRIKGEESVFLPFMNRPLPGLCTYKELLGLDCPGCGMTRSFICIGHGELSRAWRYNAVGLFMYGLVATQIPFRVVQLSRMRRGQMVLEWNRIGLALLAILAALLIAQWGVRLMPHWTT